MSARRRARLARLARLALAAAAASLALGTGCASARGTTAVGTPAAASATNDEQDIRDALQASADGWNRADIDAHLAPDADTMTFMTGRGPLRGKEKTREALLRSFWRDGRPLQPLRFESVQVRMLGRDHALVLGRFILEGNAERKETSGWFSLTWARTPDGWQVIHDHSS